MINNLEKYLVLIAMKQVILNKYILNIKNQKENF